MPWNPKQHRLFCARCKRGKGDKKFCSLCHEGQTGSERKPERKTDWKKESEQL